MQTLTEGSTQFVTDSTEKITKDMPVFYNPVMKLNRDLSLLVVRTLDNPKIGLPMEASGIRAARIVNELIDNDWRPHSILVNDISVRAIELCRKNVTHEAAVFSVEDANAFMRRNKPFDYLDIDPFGPPNQFLDAAVQAVRNGGILAVTATDTSALAGTYPRTTRRKYWAEPSRTWAMHDIGLRILIRKVQLVGAQYTRALTPLLSIATDHYYRVFFRADTGADKVKEIIRQHTHVRVDQERMEIAATENIAGSAGPLWVGKLHDKKFVSALAGRASGDAGKLLSVIEDECRIDMVGFYDMHEIASHLGKESPKRETFFAKLGSHVCRTHVSPTGFKTDLPMKKIKAAF